MIIKRYCQFLPDREIGVEDAKLRYRVRWSEGIAAFSVGCRVVVDKWSQETQRCKLSTTHGKGKVSASVINKELQRMADLCDGVFASYEASGVVPSVLQFKDSFNFAIGRTRKVSVRSSVSGFFGVFDEFVSLMGSQNSWSDATYVKFKSIRLHLYSFDPALSFASLTDNVLESYVRYLHRVPLRNTTIIKNLAFVRWFLRWASHRNLYAGKCHETFRPKLKGTDGNSKEVIHLSWDELVGLHDFVFPKEKEHLVKIRDVFCFCCFTGLRYSDVAKLCRSDVLVGSISVVTQKTSDSLVIELNKYSRAILDRYADIPFPGDRALPVISNAGMNERLKDMGEAAGLSAPTRVVYFMGNSRKEEVLPKYSLLTTHCGRRTFIVNALFLGIPAEVIMKWSGHSDFKAMKPYIKIVDKLKAQEMAKFDSYGLVPVLQNGDQSVGV